MKVTYLKDHPIIYDLEMIIDTYDLDSINNTKEEIKPTSQINKEQYVLDILGAIGAVTSCIDQLYYAIGMLAGFRSSVAPMGMERLDYIIYGTENFYLRITSVYDRCLRVTNTAYQLGLPARQCKNETVIDNDHLRGSYVVKALKKIDKFSDQFRDRRNIIAHKDTNLDSDLRPIVKYFYGSQMNEVLDFFYLDKKEADEYIAIKKNKFEDHLNNLEELVGEFFSELQQALEPRLNSFK